MGRLNAAGTGANCAAEVQDLHLAGRVSGLPTAWEIVQAWNEAPRKVILPPGRAPGADGGSPPISISGRRRGCHLPRVSSRGVCRGPRVGYGTNTSETKLGL